MLAGCNTYELVAGRHHQKVILCVRITAQMQPLRILVRICTAANETLVTLYLPAFHLDLA